MQNKTSVTPIIIIGAIVVAFSVGAFFLLDIERTALYCWALAFLLVSEVALFAGIALTRMMGANHNKVFLRSGVTTTLLLYFFATVIGVFFTGRFVDRLNSFILMQLAIVVVAAIILVAVCSIAGRVAVSDSKTVNARAFMDSCEIRIRNLISDTKNKDYAAALNGVFESIKYSDKVGISSVDVNIDAAISRLEASLGEDERNDEGIKGTFDELSSLLNRRKAEIGQAKRGGF